MWFPGNLLLQGTIERIHIGDEYGDIPRGIYLVRGENVALCGEIVRTSRPRACVWKHLRVGICACIFYYIGCRAGGQAAAEGGEHRQDLGGPETAAGGEGEGEEEERDDFEIERHQSFGTHWRFLFMNNTPGLSAQSRVHFFVTVFIACWEGNKPRPLLCVASLSLLGSKRF